MNADVRQPDSIARLRRVRGLATVGGAIALVAVGAWALWAAPSAFEPTWKWNPPTSETVTDEVSPEMTQVDIEVFQLARLWNPQSPPAKPAPKQEERIVVKRPQLELIGIIEDGERCLAAVYDLERRKMLIVASGDRIDPYLVAAITPSQVRLEDGRFVAQLSVRSEGRGP